MQVTTALSPSPSFSSYSKVVEIAARTADEFDCDEFSDERKNSAAQNDEEFEFLMTARDSESSSEISADEIFQNDPASTEEAVSRGKENDDYDVVKLVVRGRRARRRSGGNLLRLATEGGGGGGGEVPCKKCSSAGCNSKRWKLKDFLHRSRSHGCANDYVVSKENEKKYAGTPADGGKVEAVAPPCNLNGGEKQRSYLGYGHDLAGLFGDGNALR